MPWDASDFRSHNLKLNRSESAHGARIANAILRTGAPEGEAIATANKYFQRHDVGGIVDPTSGGIGGITPSNQTANPMMQGMIQRYASLPPERLQELSVMMGGSPQGQIIQRILQQKRTQPNAAAPVAQCRGGRTPRRDIGGGMSMSQADPTWARNDMSQETRGGGATGYLHGTTSGRADAILTTAPAGSYVIPADVVAGLGEGNSLAGARVMDQIIRTGPHGIPMQRNPGVSHGPPRAPGAFRESKGGPIGRNAARQEQTPVALSHGEFVVPMEHVMHWGGGDLTKGHKVFDEFVVRMRKHIIDQMKKLPGPVKSKAA